MSGTTSKYTISVDASASFGADAPPAFNLVVDGDVIGQGVVNSNNVETLTFTANLTPGQAHKVSIVYTNHTSTSQMLNLQSIAIDGKTLSYAAAGEQYISTHGTQNGWGQMYYGGTIDFAVPSSYFSPSTPSSTTTPTSATTVAPTATSAPTTPASSTPTTTSTPTATSAPSGSPSGTTPSTPSTTGDDTITVTACASYSTDDYPQFNLLVDGTIIGSGTVSSTNNMTFTFDANLTPGIPHEIDIDYTNHTSTAEMLNVRSISVNGQTVAASSSSETYVSNNGTHQGDGQMYLGGDAKFALGASYFPQPVPTASSTQTPATATATSASTVATTPSATTTPATPPATPPADTPATPTVATPATPAATTATSVPNAVYVSATGSDTTGNGTASNPFGNIQYALKDMESSGVHTLYVESGILDVTSTATLTAADSGDTIAAAPGATATLDAAGGVSSLISLTGVGDVTVSGLTFENASTDAQQAALTVNESTGDTISGNTFANNGEGVLFASGSSKDTFSGNTVTNSATSGVEVKDGSDNDVFSDNTVNGVGAINTTGGAFYGHGISGDTFSNNLVENTAGAGIAIEDFGSGTENSNNTVTANTLLDTSDSTASTDTGAIYLLGRSDNNLQTSVSMNFISGVGNVNPDAHAEGIYLDDNASGVSVTSNIIQGVQSDDMEIHGGSDVSVSNNILNLGASTQTAVYVQQPPSDQPATVTPALTGDSITGNIITSTQSAPDAVFPYFDSETVSLAIKDNLYWDPNTQGNGLPTTSPLTDSAPVVGNPLFTQASSGDYALGSGSAASEIGFKTINQGLIGPGGV